MAYKESAQRAAEVASLALDRMERLEMAAHPDNYEVWYAYHADVDAELSRKLDDLLAKDGSFDANAFSDVKQGFLGEETTQILRTASDGVEALISSALSSIDAASTNARDYGDALADFSGDLSSASKDDVRALVAKIIVNTRDVITRNASLEGQLQEAGDKIEKLRDSLDDARRASETDGLTNLPNRRAFDLGLEAEMERARQDRQPLTLLIADVDHFKKFNDTFGHRVGDEVLKLVGRILRSMIKGRDKPARYGGEEFCILLPTTDTEGGFAVAEQVRKAIGAKALKSARSGQSYGHITLSLGCATLHPGDTAASLIDRADAALYLAKTYGRNRTCTEDDLDDARKAV